ncbi:MAG: hypothetical protein AABX36_03660, partial [Candidatus Thermoplasmatota archaeon]
GDAFRARRGAAAGKAARRAESLAKLLARAHAASTDAIAKLQAERKRMASMGAAIAEIDALIVRASTSMKDFVERDGDARFPAYEEAERLAGEGLELARDGVPKFVETLRAISDAEERLRSAQDTNRYISRDLFESSVLKSATVALQEARKALSAGDYGGASEGARRAMAHAQAVERESRRAIEAFERADDIVRNLRSEGAAVAAIEASLERARTALAAADFASARTITEEAGVRIAELRETHRSILLLARSARDAIAQVEDWGFNVREPRILLREAEGLIPAGRYDDAAAALERARTMALGIRETHRSMAARISDLRRPVTAMRTRDPIRAIEGDGLLAEAESLLDQGLYGDCAHTLDSLSELLTVPVDDSEAGVSDVGDTKPIDAKRTASL